MQEERLLIAARNKAFLATLLASLLLVGCSGKIINDPELLQQARANAQSSIYGIWAKRPSRVLVAINPKSTAMYPVLESNLSLTGVYRDYPGGENRFALAMPQGTLIGSCVRNPAGELSFQSLSPLAAVGELVRASFHAVDEFLAAAPKAGDTWRLQEGDVRGGISKSNEVLVRRRHLDMGSYVHYVYDLNGHPIVFYQLSNQSLDWRLYVNTKAANISYTFRDYRFNWQIAIELTQ